MTHEQMLIQIEAFKKQIPDELKQQFIPTQMEYYQKFLSYLLLGHSDNDWLPETAAILTDLVVDIALSKDGPPPPTEILAFFDIYHDLLQTSTQNRVGNMLPAAATLCKKMAYFYFQGDENNGSGDNLPIAYNDTFTASPGGNFDYDAIVSNDELFGKAITGLELRNYPNEVQYLSESNSYVVTIPEDYSGIIYYEYRIQTEAGWSNWASVTINVGNVPVAINDEVTIRQGEPWTYGVGNNDITGGQNVNFHIDVQPSHGTFNEYGQYTPDPGYVGDDEYHYYISNEFGVSNIAVVTIHILAANPFDGTTVDLTSEENQGRITWSFNWNVSAGITIGSITNVTLSVPTATPNTVSISHPGSNMITPAPSGMRTEIAHIANTNYLYFMLEYTQDAIVKNVEMQVLLPHFSMELYQSLTGLPVIFVDPLGL